MNNQPLVCICIPNYNNEKTISETLDSLVNQTYKNIIIKIFDNASTDGSMKILKEYESEYPKIRVFQNAINIGGEANFTKCIEGLEGDFGAIFHADDLYDAKMVEMQVGFLEQHKSCSAVAVHGYIIDEHSNIIGERYLPQEFMESEFNVVGNQISLFKSILKNGNYITCPSVMTRTKIYKEDIQAWNGTDFKTSADLDVWLRLANFGKFGVISIPLIKYRESTTSYSYKETRTRTGENNMFLVLNYYLEKFRGKGVLSKNDFARYEFLVFKDNINRTINQILRDDFSFKLKIDVFNLKVLKVAFQSFSNFKIYIIGLIVKLFRNIVLPNTVKNKIFEIRFKGTKI